MSADRPSNVIHLHQARRRAQHEVELDRLLFFVRSASGALGRVMRSNAGDTGLTKREQLALRIVVRFGEVTHPQLAALMAVHPRTAGRLVLALTGKGLLTRTPRRGGRQTLLVASAAGRQLDASVPDPVWAALASAVAKLPAAKVEAAREVLLQLWGATERELASPREEAE